MSADLSNFKSSFGDSDITVVYLDSQGREIPIKNEREFQEAVRLTKLSKTRLKLILYYNKSKANNTSVKNQCGYSDTATLDVPLRTVEPGTVQDSASKEKCQCNRDVPPDWFINYMDKFRKDFLKELKSSLCETVQSMIEKEKKLSNLKKEATEMTCSKIEATSAPLLTQSKKKKKATEKDLGDLLEHWEMKSVKKNEKLHPTKVERLEKLDNKTKVLLEEKRKLLEKKRHSKQRLDKNYGITSEAEKFKKSAFFHRKETHLFLPLSADFAVTINFTNDGMLRWEAPWLECFDFNGLYPKEMRINLPRLQPMESGLITVRGKAANYEGVHHFKCRLYDGLRNIGSEFTCWAQVDTKEPVKKIPNALFSSKESHNRKKEGLVGILLDLEKDEFAATQKKIEENINEIERRLQDIDLLCPSASLEDNITNNARDVETSEEFRFSGRDSFRNIEGKEINWKEELEQDEVLFGVDCLRLTTPNINQKKQHDENGKVENFEKLQKNELECSSDSELSMIFMSEEDENFVVVPLQAKSPSPAESVNEDKKSTRIPFLGTVNLLKVKPGFQEQKSLESLRADIIESTREGHSIIERRERLPGPLRTRRPLGEVLKSKPKKIKPSSTEYHFTSDNLTQPTFTLIPERFLEERPSKFTFTGDKCKEKPCSEDVLLGRPSRWTSAEGKGEKEKMPAPECEFFDHCSKLAPTKEKEENLQKKDDLKGYTIPTIDASRKIIYAVNGNGHCIPVGDLLEEWDHCRNSNRGNEVLANEFLSSVIVNGASNVALLAFKTAKSVINNLHSAFVSEGKTEVGKPAYQNTENYSLNAMSTLLKMGFMDIETNQKLLLIHQNDVTKVVEDLIKLQEISSRRNA